MASGLPVVCHRHGGYADAVRHGANGKAFKHFGRSAFDTR
ncbi:MAG: hypothetical protein PW999_19945 [Paraburkholderia tropica]|nr:hypothetical protein [Paraburkholderia tropica]MDE1141872.1 hypothetical protein [Paraburkholderia tropica]